MKNKNDLNDSWIEYALIIGILIIILLGIFTLIKRKQQFTKQKISNITINSLKQNA